MRNKNVRVRNAGFVCIEKTYNNDLIWPYDVLQHTLYPGTTDFIRTFIITPDGEPFTTSEGIQFISDYSFDTAPQLDILVIPGTDTSTTKDLDNQRYLNWLKKAVEKSSHVRTIGRGVFPLAKIGALDGRSVTTFPGSTKQLIKMFPKVKVRKNAHFVVDGKYITSVGGHESHDPALYLVEKLYSKKVAKGIARGLVMEWDLKKMPHIIIKEK
jgi:transcriptional regulator GlxA family with amidase domain